MRLIVAALLSLSSAAALAQAPFTPAVTPREPPPMKSLGGDKYTIGNVLIEKRARRITVPGHVAHLGNAPLEYLAVSTKGMKAYETLLELDATGTEFNLALILIGFDAELSTRPDHQFDRRFPAGQLADIQVRWLTGSKLTTISAAQALLTDAQQAQMPPTQWVYTGSFTLRNGGDYAADRAGTLVGFVHDPADVLEHREGLGIGKYGSIRGNTAVLPPLNTPIELIVTATGDKIPLPPGYAPPP